MRVCIHVQYMGCVVRVRVNICAQICCTIRLHMRIQTMHLHACVVCVAYCAYSCNGTDLSCTHRPTPFLHTQGVKPACYEYLPTAIVGEIDLVFVLSFDNSVRPRGCCWWVRPRRCRWWVGRVLNLPRLTCLGFDCLSSFSLCIGATAWRLHWRFNCGGWERKRTNRHPNPRIQT